MMDPEPTVRYEAIRVTSRGEQCAIRSRFRARTDAEAAIADARKIDPICGGLMPHIKPDTYRIRTWHLVADEVVE